ncbi:MAG TPA: GNAT family N-acetyltransferase [Bacillus sp. (in: firmicutes)]|nr:GNAT family N-acetyltransferase [Bacillus sp. (in: firmicutes)]
MYQTRWAEREEMLLLAEYWYRMACEMGDIDGIPAPDLMQVNQVRNLFLKEYDSGNLLFRVAMDLEGKIVSCAGGLLRMEYAFPLSQELTPFGWIISVYTVEQHRKKGLAHLLVEEVCEWLKEKGAKRARLWSSSSAKNVYKDLGFTSMLDMEKPLV